MIVVNLFGSPGVGKSTGAAYIFSKLKMEGVNVELVTEFAKDIVWDEAERPLQSQEYVFGNQSYRINRLRDKVDVVITDSPVLLSCLYGHNETDAFKQAVYEKFNQHTNMNYLIKQPKNYSNIGRIHTKEESDELNKQLLSLLSQYNIPFFALSGIQKNYDAIVEEVLDALHKGGDAHGEKIQ